jgi:serine/threonine protein kinase
MLSALRLFPTLTLGTVQSLGCVLFALAYLHSPFENTQTTEQGGSIAMAVLNAQYKHPPSGYSQGLRSLIDSMLKTNPQERPDIQQVTLLIRFAHNHSYSCHFRSLMQQSNCSTLHDYGICDQRHIDIFVIYIDCPVLLLVPTSAWWVRSLH